MPDKDPKGMSEPELVFEDKTDAKLAEQQFATLRAQPAWVRIHDFMSEKLKYYNWMLRNHKFESKEEINEIQRAANITEQFMNLPDIIVEFLKRSQGEELNFDPYKGEIPSSQVMRDFDPYPQHTNVVDTE